MSAGIVWENPPAVEPGPVAKTRPDMADFADELRAHPGQWARYPRPIADASAPPTARAIRLGHRQAWEPAGAFEAVTRTVGGRRIVFVRYVGPS